MPNRVSLDTIIAAKSGDSESMTLIMRHYKPYITTFSKRPFYDEYGNCYEFIDDEIRQRIETKLTMQIIYRFDPTRLPNHDFL